MNIIHTKSKPQQTNIEYLLCLTNNLSLIIISWIVVMYILFAIIPFFFGGVYLKDPEAVLAGMYGPTSIYDVIPFSHFIAFRMMFVVPFLAPIFLVVSIVMSYWLRQHYKRNEKILIIFILTIGLLNWLFVVITPLGNLITTWIMD